MASCVAELQSASHSLFHQAMLMDTESRASLLQVSQSLDGIVLKLNHLQQTHRTAPQQIDKQTESRAAPKELLMNDSEIEEYTITQDDVDEINQEMTDLFGSPVSSDHS